MWMHVHGSLNRLISCGPGEWICVLYKYTTIPVVSASLSMIPVTRSRQYLFCCVLLFISFRSGYCCRDSVFINSLSIISECRNQMGDMLLLMCQIPSFIDLFDSGKYYMHFKTFLWFFFFIFFSVNAECSALKLYQNIIFIAF
jgi:hypothetical protein